MSNKKIKDRIAFDVIRLYSPLFRASRIACSSSECFFLLAFCLGGLDYILMKIANYAPYFLKSKAKMHEIRFVIDW